MKRNFLFQGFMILTLVFSAALADEPCQRHALITRTNIFDTAAADGRFNTFLTAIEKTGMKDMLRCEGPYTVFIPTDQAFAKLGDCELAQLLKPENCDRLGAILRNHIVCGNYSRRRVRNSLRLITIDASTIQVRAQGNILRVGPAGLVNTDIGCANGIIHVVNVVMMPK